MSDSAPTTPLKQGIPLVLRRLVNTLRLRLGRAGLFDFIDFFFQRSFQAAIKLEGGVKILLCFPVFALREFY